MSAIPSTENVAVVVCFVIFSMIGFVLGVGIGCIVSEEPPSRNIIIPENVAYMIVVAVALFVVIGTPVSFFLRRIIQNIGISILVGFSFGTSFYAVLSLILREQCLT